MAGPSFALRPGASRLGASTRSFGVRKCPARSELLQPARVPGGARGLQRCRALLPRASWRQSACYNPPQLTSCRSPRCTLAGAPRPWPGWNAAAPRASGRFDPPGPPPACLPALRPLGLPEPAAPPEATPLNRNPSYGLLSANGSGRLSLSPASHSSGPAPFRLSANSSRRSLPAAPRLPLTARRRRPRSSSSRHPLHHLRPRRAARHAGTCSSDAEGF